MKEYLINGKTYRLNVFEKIENKEQAYLIGYLAGDGGFNPPTYKRKARLYVSSVEESIIQAIKEEFCPDGVINSKIPINKTSGYSIKTDKFTYTLNFSSKFESCFNKFGVLNKKPDRTLVNISKKNMRYYIHGLFDADGHASWGRRKDRNRLWVNVAITHQSWDILTKIQNFLVEELNIASTVRQRKTENCIDLRFSNRDSAVTFLTWMYEVTPKFFNKTKKQIADNFLREYCT